jgi:hypothetical protein
MVDGGFLTRLPTVRSCLPNSCTYLLYLPMYLSTYIRIYLHTHRHTCIHLYKRQPFIQTDRNTGKHTYRQTYRPTHRNIYRNTYRNTYMHICNDAREIMTFPTPKTAGLAYEPLASGNRQQPVEPLDRFIIFLCRLAWELRGYQAGNPSGTHIPLSG